MQANVLARLVEEHNHLRLRQLHGIVVELHIELNLPVGRLVKQNVGLGE